MILGMVRARLGRAMLKLVQAFVPTLPSTEEAGQTQLSGLGKSAGGPQAEHRASELIAATGQGSMAIAPDAVRAELGVEVRARMLTQARDELTAKVETLTQAIMELGHENLSVQTSDLRIVPLYDEPMEGQPSKIAGYRARNTLMITLRNVPPASLGAEAATIIDAGVSAGANIVEGVSFFLSDPQQVQGQALAMAIADAERNANIMANSAGVSITALHDINGISDRPGPILFNEDLALRSMARIEPGEVSIMATVAVRYHFAR